jgi:hypothetical protein
MALRNHREILSHRGLDVVPFFQQLARGDRLGFHTEQLSGLPIIARRRLGRRGRRIRSIFDERDSFEFVGSQKGTLLPSTSRPLSRWCVGDARQSSYTNVCVSQTNRWLPQTHYDIEIQEPIALVRPLVSAAKENVPIAESLQALQWRQNERLVRQAAPLLERFNL